VKEVSAKYQPVFHQLSIIVIVDVKGPREVKGYHATKNNHALTTALLLVDL
jgi:hypothetical protein